MTSTDGRRKCAIALPPNGSARSLDWTTTPSSPCAAAGGRAGERLVAMAESLPPEMLSYILSFLPLSDQKEASLVNRAWYFAAQTALREIDVRYIIPVASASLTLIKSLGRRRVSCISLTDVDSSADASNVLQSISYHLGPHLHSLSLGGGTVTEVSFIELVTSCPGLQVLDLSGCNSLFMSGMLLGQPETAQRVREALANLRELNLSNLRYLADITFTRLSSCAPKLERLSLARCHITFDSHHGLSARQDSSAILSFRNILHFLKERAGHLVALDLSGTNLSPMALQALGQVVGLRLQELTLRGCRDISVEAVATLCRQQRGLTSLDLSGCSELADGALLAVSRGLRGLRHLRMEKLQRLTDAGFSALHGLQELRSLDIAECCLVSGRELAKALEFPKGPPPHFTSLRLAYCSLLKDASVMSLAQGLGSSLKVLDLSSCVSLTNSSLLAISANLPQLTVLRLAWCKEITDSGLLGLVDPGEEKDKGPKLSRNFGDTGFFLPQLPPEPSAHLESPSREAPNKQLSPSLLMLRALQELDLTACSRLTDTSLAKVLRFPHLKQLSLSLLLELTDTGLVAVAKGCPSLEHLALSHCSRLSDRGWAQAAEFWRRLRHLNLSSCNQLTEQTLVTIGKACQRLKVLDVSMCQGISMAAVEHFQAQLPQVTCVQSRFVGGADLAMTL
ncbi:leucine-rich repeat-containing protein 29 [Dromiciops gliroides]|uniref:leucine-rich repeat-containing protein 29 n=1 Tax=Dromiciops gliroides TaxID=33562 RepID=UPI001CC3E04B|nr:leucine-rich repeat-containing protein 29 [Dromiciops gliroides]